MFDTTIQTISFIILIALVTSILLSLVFYLPMLVIREIRYRKEMKVLNEEEERQREEEKKRREAKVRL